MFRKIASDEESMYYIAFLKKDVRERALRENVQLFLVTREAYKIDSFFLGAEQNLRWSGVMDVAFSEKIVVDGNKKRYLCGLKSLLPVENCNLGYFLRMGIRYASSADSRTLQAIHVISYVVFNLESISKFRQGACFRTLSCEKIHISDAGLDLATLRPNGFQSFVQRYNFEILNRKEAVIGDLSRLTISLRKLAMSIVDSLAEESSQKRESGRVSVEMPLFVTTRPTGELFIPVTTTEIFAPENYTLLETTELIPILEVLLNLSLPFESNEIEDLIRDYLSVEHKDIVERHSAASKRKDAAADALQYLDPSLGTDAKLDPRVDIDLAVLANIATASKQVIDGWNIAGLKFITPWLAKTKQGTVQPQEFSISRFMNFLLERTDNQPMGPDSLFREYKNSITRWIPMSAETSKTSLVY